VVIGENDAHFLRQQATQIRLIAQKCLPHIRDELLSIAEGCERRARLIEEKGD
jgi:hypothetical protein